jgi:hypothetical protein
MQNGGIVEFIAAHINAKTTNPSQEDMTPGEREYVYPLSSSRNASFLSDMP